MSTKDSIKSISIIAVSNVVTVAYCSKWNIKGITLMTGPYTRLLNCSHATASPRLSSTVDVSNRCCTRWGRGGEMRCHHLLLLLRRQESVKTWTFLSTDFVRHPPHPLSPPSPPERYPKLSLEDGDFVKFVDFEDVLEECLRDILPFTSTRLDHPFRKEADHVPQIKVRVIYGRDSTAATSW